MGGIARSTRLRDFLHIAPSVVLASLLVASCQFVGPIAARSLPTRNSPAETTRSRPVASAATVTKPVLSVRVVGNHLVNAKGKTIRLLGVNRPGMEALGLHSGCWVIPANVSEINAMIAWHINTVRIPLNEDCWLGINRVTLKTASAYRTGLHRYVSLLHQHKLYAILDLHVSAPGAMRALYAQGMPDADHSPKFWSSVASSFIGDRAVVFDLFNEPHPDEVIPLTTNGWTCWLHGCTVPTAYSASAGRRLTKTYSWKAAGMQQLVNAVRATGAKQPVLIEGTDYANNLSSWVAHVPSDPARQVVASDHIYNEKVGCVNLTCWTRQLPRIAAAYPVVTGEFGEADCAHGFMDQYMKFADSHGISYLGWSWSLETNCHLQYAAAMITNWSGTPSSSGKGLRNHLAVLAG